MPPQTSLRVLVVDDEPSMLSGLTRLLQRDGYIVQTAENGQAALDLLAAHPFDLILCDLRMPELDGQTFYGRLLLHYPSLGQRVIFLTGDLLSPDNLEFLERSGQPWIPKPCRVAAVRMAIAQVLRRKDAQA